MKPAGETTSADPSRPRADRGRVRTRAAVALLLAAGACALLAGFIVFTGGVSLRLAGIPLRARSWERPALLAAVAALAALVMLRSQIRSWIRAVLLTLRPPGERQQRVLVGLAVASTAALSLAFGTYVAGGSDSFGYVSQARLFASGRLVETHPSHAAFTWPSVSATFAPLGYRPGAAPGTVAPTYPPGLPLLMAPLAAVDTRAAFLVVPLSAAIAVWLCWQLGVALREPLAGALGACLLAASPTFLYQAVQPMSDVPVTACWTAALLLARRHGTRSSVAAGLVAGLAILIRPNLAPLAAFVVLSAATAAPRGGLLRAGACGLALVPGITTLGAINWVRFGSPLTSGYGSVDYLFAIANIGPNLDRYPAWLTATHTPFIWVWLLAPWWLRNAPAEVRSLGWLCWGFSLAVIAAYLPYAVFNPDEWSYTRFLLPALPSVLVLGVAVTRMAARRMVRYPEAAAVLLVTMVIVAQGAQAVSRGAFELITVERRYPAVGTFVREELPADAIVIADQHSGSVRFYAGRPTLRWTLLDRASLDEAVNGLRRAGYTPFVVLDGHEVPWFHERFASSPAVLDRLTLVAMIEGTRIYGIRLELE